MDRLFLEIILPVLLSCNSNGPVPPALIINKNILAGNFYNQVKSIPLPPGFQRVTADPGSFAAYLREIELKKDKTVYLYNGQPKLNQLAQYAVLAVSVGNQDLQQCADAAIRLRAAYLFEQKQFEQIVFYDNDKTAYRFLPPYTREHFTNYLNRVFGMCGTLSLSKQLKSVSNFSAIQPGDIIIRGGSPGHAVIVMDVAANPKGEKIYLLAQSYMPAQDIHVLKNPIHAELSPWYPVADDHIIQTPEYRFTRNELKRW